MPPFSAFGPFLINFLVHPPSGNFAFPPNLTMAKRSHSTQKKGGGKTEGVLKNLMAKKIGKEEKTPMKVILGQSSEEFGERGRRSVACVWLARIIHPSGGNSPSKPAEWIPSKHPPPTFPALATNCPPLSPLSLPIQFFQSNSTVHFPFSFSPTPSFPSISLPMATLGECPASGGGLGPASPLLPLASPQQPQRHSGRHTIHPKLSLSAKRSTASMTAGAGGPQQQPNGTGASTSFQLTVAFSNVEGGAPITFKQDGSRFQTSQRTFKLQSNCKYKITLKTKPAQDFLSLHIGGSDLELVTADGQPPGSGEYSSIWNTTGIDPTKKGVRQDILFILSGPGKTLSRKVQTKFYGRQSSHAAMGHRLDALIWSCELDPIGQVKVTDEKLV